MLINTVWTVDNCYRL